MWVSFHGKSCPSFTLIPTENRFLLLERQLPGVLCHSELSVALNIDSRGRKHQADNKSEERQRAPCLTEQGPRGAPGAEHTLGEHTLRSNQQQRMLPGWRRAAITYNKSCNSPKQSSETHPASTSRDRLPLPPRVSALANF